MMLDIVRHVFADSFHVQRVDEPPSKQAKKKRRQRRTKTESEADDSDERMYSSWDETNDDFVAESHSLDRQKEVNQSINQSKEI